MNKDIEIIEIGDVVSSVACEIFYDCDALSDFCVQYIGSNAIVFGGTNRLILNKDGWYIDEDYCTERFIELFNQKFGG